jgi:hypothetical protein
MVGGTYGRNCIYDKNIKNRYLWGVHWSSGLGRLHDIVDSTPPSITWIWNHTCNNKCGACELHKQHTTSSLLNVMACGCLDSVSKSHSLFRCIASNQPKVLHIKHSWTINASSEISLDLSLLASVQIHGISIDLSNVQERKKYLVPPLVASTLWRIWCS